jgi:hypothetical protein
LATTLPEVAVAAQLNTLPSAPPAPLQTPPPGFDGTYAAWQASGPSCSCAKRAPATRCVASIHSYSGDGDEVLLRLVLAGVRARGYSMSYITSVTTPNPYRMLPSFWAAEVNAACATPRKP